MFNYKQSSKSSMWRQPTVWAGFCLQIKVFNYTQPCDKMALTSHTVTLYEQDRNGSTQEYVAAYTEHLKWMCNQQSTIEPTGCQWFPSVLKKKLQKETAVSFSTHLVLQCMMYTKLMRSDGSVHAVVRIQEPCVNTATDLESVVSILCFGNFDPLFLRGLSHVHTLNVTFQCRILWRDGTRCCGSSSKFS